MAGGKKLVTTTRLVERSVLVVDDAPAMRHAITLVLREMGLKQIVEAATGREAIRLLETLPIMAVIANWNMPGVTGLGLLRWLRSRPEGADLPFLLVTADTTRERFQAAQNAGVTDYIVKPFTAHLLANKMRRLLEVPEDEEVPPLLAWYGKDRVIGVSARQDVDSRVLGSTVMVVDDVPSSVELIATVLSDTYNIVTATSGMEALRLLETAPLPDLILLDVSMPELDGHSVCRQIKCNPALADIPIIFLTAKDLADDVVLGLELGAVDYVAKPAEPAVLRARIHTHLQLKLAFADLAAQNAALAASAELREDVERITQHDLKNPLSAIIQGADLLITRGQDARGERTLRMIKSSAWRAVDMVNQSLHLFQIETGKYRLRPERLSVAAVLEELCAETETAFAHHKLSVVLAARQDDEAKRPFLVSGDHALCRSLFGNLLRNAAEASPNFGTVTVSLRQEESEIVITIHNAGPVLAEIRERVFEKYATAGKRAGVGLGTYTAKLVTEAQGGSVAMQTDEATGTTLTVRLPAA